MAMKINRQIVGTARSIISPAHSSRVIDREATLATALRARLLAGDYSKHSFQRWS